MARHPLLAHIVGVCAYFTYFPSWPFYRTGCIFCDKNRSNTGKFHFPMYLCFYSFLRTLLVPVRKKGITSILLTSFANISQQNHATATNHATTAAAGTTGKDGISFLSDSAGPNKTRKNDFYIGNKLVLFLIVKRFICQTLRRFSLSN